MEALDYRRLNSVTRKDSYPLPRIDDTLEALSGATWFSSLDLKSGYWQVGVHPEDREKTTLTAGRSYGSSELCRSDYATPLPLLNT